MVVKLLGPNLVLCELKKSTNNLNQSPTNIITKITKPRYESQIRIQKFMRKTLFSFNGKNYERNSK